MEFNEYQRLAAETILPSAEDMNYLVPGLCAEAGEFAGKYAKIIRDKGGVIGEDDITEMQKEVGDCLWFCAMIIRQLGKYSRTGPIVTFDDVVLGNAAKLQSRKRRGVIGGSGDNR